MSFVKRVIIDHASYGRGHGSKSVDHEISCALTRIKDISGLYRLPMLMAKCPLCEVVCCCTGSNWVLMVYPLHGGGINLRESIIGGSTAILCPHCMFNQQFRWVRVLFYPRLWSAHKVLCNACPLKCSRLSPPLLDLVLTHFKQNPKMK